MSTINHQAIKCPFWKLSDVPFKDKIKIEYIHSTLTVSSVHSLTPFNHSFSLFLYDHSAYESQQHYIIVTHRHALTQTFSILSTIQTHSYLFLWILARDDLVSRKLSNLLNWKCFNHPQLFHITFFYYCQILQTTHAICVWLRKLNIIQNVYMTTACTRTHCTYGIVYVFIIPRKYTQTFQMRPNAN